MQELQYPEKIGNVGFPVNWKVFPPGWPSREERANRLRSESGNPPGARAVAGEIPHSPASR
jgi:hypothetical protein